MKDLHEVFTTFKKDFPDIYKGHEALGKKIHEGAGPLPEKVRGSSRWRCPARAATP